MKVSRPKILLIDDEPFVLRALQEGLSRHPVDITVVERGREAIRCMKSARFDLAITDVRLPDISGLEILREMRNVRTAPGFIVMTGFANVQDAVEAMKIGAFDYLTKPLDFARVEQLMLNYLHDPGTLKLQAASETPPGDGLGRLVGKSDKMQEIFNLIKRVAPANCTVLLQGESGTGKELVAEAIHDLSERRSHKFVCLNCAALPENLVESELFGHEKGAFTGAFTRRDGKFLIANNGTILLDEISEMDLHLQAKLLRVLQERQFEPLGSDKTIRVDTRVIATSNKDLRELVRKGLFREDLYYRLCVVPIRLPSLRERKDDIPLLVRHFARRQCEKNKLKQVRIEDDVFSFLAGYSWPGNVRQLENAVERAIVTFASDTLRKSHFNFLLYENESNTAFDPASLVGIPCAEIEKMAILETLLCEDGNRTRAAKLLGINVRTLRNKINEYLEQGVESKYLPVLRRAGGGSPV